MMSGRAKVTALVVAGLAVVVAVAAIGWSFLSERLDANTVTAFGSGISFDDHGDHGDIEVSAAEPTGLVLEGSKPAHFVEVQGNIAQWFDGETQVRVFSERDALSGGGDVRFADVGAAHHGVAVPFDKHVVVSIPNPRLASSDAWDMYWYIISASTLSARTCRSVTSELMPRL